jgi:hypothetical protein
MWHFDDCSPSSHFLVDSSGEGANAQQALGAACVAGISGLGVEIRSTKDMIQVPDEPQFTVDQRIAVAAWVRPTDVTGDHPIVLKRLKNQTSFSLGIHDRNIEMSVVTNSGTTVISRAPIAAGTWSHVAGMYDGTFVFLFINGQQFGQIYVGQPLRDVFAPVRIGATTQKQFFDGIVDEVFVSTEAISKDALTALACLTHPSTIASISPATSGPVLFETTVHYDVVVADNDIGFCPPSQYNFNLFSADTGIRAFADFPQFVPNVLPGTTVHFGAEVTSTTDADPGVHQIPFNVFNFGGRKFEFLTGQLTYEVATPTGCFVSTRRELMITNTSVVDDPARTANFLGGVGFGSDAGFFFGDSSGGGGVSGGFGGGPGIAGSAPGIFVNGSGTGSSSSPGSFGGTSGGIGGSSSDGGRRPPPSGKSGVWSFGQLMRDLAPTEAAAPAMVEQLFKTWLTDQNVNGFTVAARPLMQQVLLDVWPRTPAGELDLDQAPLTLQAIVNRIDVRIPSSGSAGEGRFVFGVNGPGGFPQQFTVIVEYKLIAPTDQDVFGWANAWHALSSHPFPSQEYNAALEVITRKFSGRNSDPNGVNGSALTQLRTNEIVLSPIGRWELRSFALSPTGFFHEIPVDQTPELTFLGTATLADFVNANQKTIIAETDTVPAMLGDGGAPFLGGSVFNDLIEWSAPGIANNEARFHFSLNTCNGCHGPETNTTFLMITPRFQGSEAQLSPFLTGTTAFDQTSGQARSLNELGRRKADLTNLVCNASADGGVPPPPTIGPQDAGGPPGPPLFEAGIAPPPSPPPVFDASVGLDGGGR